MSDLLQMLSNKKQAFGQCLTNVSNAVHGTPNAFHCARGQSSVIVDLDEGYGSYALVNSSTVDNVKPFEALNMQPGQSVNFGPFRQYQKGARMCDWLPGNTSMTSGVTNSSRTGYHVYKETCPGCHDSDAPVTARTLLLPEEPCKRTASAIAI